MLFTVPIKNYFHSVCLNSLCTVYTRPHPPNLQQRWASKIQLTTKKLSYFLTDFLEIKMRVQKGNCNWESPLPLGWLLAWRIQDTWQCKGECPAHARHWGEKQLPARKSHLCTTLHLGPWGTATMTTQALNHKAVANPPKVRDTWNQTQEIRVQEAGNSIHTAS